MTDIVCVRLKKGADLKKEIIRLADENDISAGTIICAVGCVSRARLRCADGISVYDIDEPCEIVSVTGTVSKERCHVHISLAKEDLSVVGGHLVEGCIINTTCELILAVSREWKNNKHYDASTGYYEAEFIKR